MTQLLEYTTEQEWLAFRTHDITSTESSALFGLSPYVTKFELFHRKLTVSDINIIKNERMAWGSRLEAAIAAGLAEDYGLIIEPFKVYARHDTVKMGSSFDFKITGITESQEQNQYRKAFQEYGEGILEIKNVDSLIYNKSWQEDEAPDHIEVQVQHQMEVTGLKWSIVCPLVGGNTLKPFIRLYDPEVGAALVEAINLFWKDVEDNKEPEPDFAKDAEFVIALHQHSTDSVVDYSDNEHIRSLLTEYDLQRKIEKEAGLRQSAIKAEILDLVDDAGKVICANMSLSLSAVSDTPPTVITEDMVGQTYGGRKGYRNFRLTVKGDK